MCGIFGYVGDYSSVDTYQIDALIAHRGPDDSGDFRDDKLLFCHRRLSIQDLSRQGHQPMYSADRNYVIIYNGEIYNHLELRLELSKKYSFSSHSDTETLLYGYIEYGEGFFKQLNGIFAFAIYHIPSGELVIVRDPFGVKPLYCYKDQKRVIFSSELKTISNTLNEKEVDVHGIVNYLYYLWSPGTQTGLKNVFKLTPGRFIKFNVNDLSEFHEESYYSLPFGKVKEIKDYKYWENELEEKLTTAIKRQLISDVPLGFFLSGGLDSSLLVAIYRRLYPDQKIQAFTIDTGNSFKEEGFEDDLRYAKLVAQHLNVDLTIVNSSIDIVQQIDHMIWCLDEPQADLAALHVENICREARKEGYVVLLSGAGGDDLFSGYRRHQMLRYINWLKYVPFSHRLLKLALKFLKGPDLRRLQKFVSTTNSSSSLDSMINSYGWQDLDYLKNLFVDEIGSKLDSYDPRKILLNALGEIPEENKYLNQLLFWDIKYFLADHNLNYTDKLSMSQGVEVRVPYLDKELVEFSTRLPVDYKLKGQTTKYILRKVAEKYLPNEIIYRSKTGFGAPVRTWVKNELKAWVSERLSEERIKEQGVFKFQAIQKLIEDNKNDLIDGSYTILSLLAIESFIRQNNLNYQSENSIS